MKPLNDLDNALQKETGNPLAFMVQGKVTPDFTLELKNQGKIASVPEKSGSPLKEAYDINPSNPESVVADRKQFVNKAVEVTEGRL